MAEAVALYSVKGGVGKTASVVNLAALSAARGRKTLLWDLDPQGAASWYLQADENRKGTAKKLLKPKSAAAGITPSAIKNLWVLPTRQDQHHLEHLLAEKKDSGFRVAKVLDGLLDEFEEIWIDTPPGLSLLADNVLRASDMILVPIVPTHLSLRTWHQLKAHLMSARIKPGNVSAFLTMVDRRRVLHRNFAEKHRSELPELLEPQIPYASLIEQMGDTRMPSVLTNARHPASRAYMSLWRAIEQHFS